MQVAAGWPVFIKPDPAVHSNIIP